MDLLVIISQTSAESIPNVSTELGTWDAEMTHLLALRSSQSKAGVGMPVTVKDRAGGTWEQRRARGGIGREERGFSKEPNVS